MARYRRFDVTGETRVVPLAELEDVRLRRAGLKAALSSLEIALASPVRHRTMWVDGVRDGVQMLYEVWMRHIVETEAPGAFLDELVAEAPRLSTPASRLRRDHNDVLAAITRAEKMLATPPADDDSYASWVDDMRSDLTALLIALVKHRQKGADLIYEAYDVDIGGGF